MRFAYIDSQGNEVPIPSVEALGLRIELGAIGPDTELYDAQSDRWGPAQTHEIFHTLSRDSSDDGGFVAPPPPVPPPPPEEPPPAPSPPEAAGTNDLSDLATELGIVGDEPTPPMPEPPAAAAPSGAAEDLDFDLTFTEEGFGAAQAEEPEPPAEEAPPVDDAGVAPDGKDEPEEPVPDALEFGTLTPLDLDEVVDVAASDPGDAPPPIASEEPTYGEPVFGAEPTMDFTGEGDEEGTLEPSIGGLEGNAPPAWIEQTGPDWGAGDDEVGTMRFGPGGADLDADLDEYLTPETPAPTPRPPSRPERPEPRARPTPPRRARRRSITGILGWIVILGLVGGGGYYGWQLFGSDFFRGRSEEATPELPPVAIPEIPTSLEPRLRELGDEALDGMTSTLRALPGEMGLQDEPRNDWLSGAYLANASQFPDISEYWRGIESFVDRVRDTDTQVFHDHFAASLEQAGIEGDTARLLQARADSGFLAMRSERFEAYAEMDDLVNAALDLHQFLLRNEADIEYAPAAGGYSRDPVLEAVPATKALGDEMWAMVDRITEALDALGTLDKVTTDRLAEVLLDRIHAAGFR